MGKKRKKPVSKTSSAPHQKQNAPSSDLWSRLARQWPWLLFPAVLVLLGVMSYWRPGAQPASRAATPETLLPPAAATLLTSTPTELARAPIEPSTPTKKISLEEATPTREDRPVAWRLTILHTNDTRGYLDPCG